MKVITTNDHAKIIRLERGEEFVSAIKKFCKEGGYQGGVFYGIGGATEATLSHYILKESKYESKHFSGDLEIASVMGNVAMNDDGLIIHAHATIGLDDLQAVAGHVEKITIAGTCEVHFEPILKGLERQSDDETGLDLLHPKPE